MKNLKILLLSLASSFGAFAADLDVTPGALQGLLPDGGKGQEEIKLKGRIDARDLAALESLSPDVKSLDLSEVTIEGFSTDSRQYFGKTLFQEGEIPAYTFFDSKLSSLILPAGVQTIGDGAFAGSNITSIVIPEGITALGDYTFYGCKNLQEVSLPSSLKKIGKGTFSNCASLTSVDLASTGIEEIPEHAFAGALLLESVQLPASVRTVGREAFSHTHIGSLALGGVTRFEAFALSGMPFLTTLAINPQAEIADGLLMDNTSLVSLTGMPENVPDYFAANCAALPAEAAAGVATLGRYSFANTQSPEVLILAGLISRIDRGALSGLAGLKRIDATALEGNVPEVDEFSFEGLSQPDIELKVSDDAYSLWAADPVWSLFNLLPAESTAVEEIESGSAQGIAIGYGHGLITVSSPATVSEVRIYTSDGRIAFMASPGDSLVEIDASSLPSGILIVTATDGEGESATASLLVK